MITVFIIGLIKAYRASKHTNELALHVISTGVLAVFFTLYVIQVVFKTHTVIVDESTLKYALAIEVLTAQYIIDLIARKERAKLDKSTLSSTEFEKTTNRRKGKSKLDTLSAREREVYNLIIEGYRTNEISNRLYISVNTVKFHKKNIYRKMNVCTQDELLKLNEQTQSCSQTNG